MIFVWLLVCLVAGFTLGAFYFGCLWWTVRRLPTLRQPGLVLFVSFVARTVVVVAGFYAVSGGRWQRIVACLVGFLLARALLVRRWGPQQMAVNTG